MSNIVIQVRNLSKRYRIGLKEELHDTFMGTLAAWIKSPINNYKRLKRLSTFKKTENDDDVIWALKNISFEVSQGEVLGIIGENGAGKSTLLKILSRITEPTSGEASIDGRVASLLEVGTGFHQELTGRENIYLNGTLLGMKKVEVDKKLDEIVDFSGVEKFIDTPVKRYSSGMRVRLAFAVAAHLEPEILLIDEVLAVGDAAFQKKAVGKMGSVVQEGRTVLFVSHNMTAVESLCPKTMWIQNGGIKDFGESNRIISSYLQKEMKIGTLRVWNNPKTAPGNEKIRIHKAAVYPKNESDEIKVDSPICLEFQFWHYNSEAQINLTAQIFTLQSIHAFSTFSRSVVLDEGLYKFVCNIPGGILNDETYKVQLLFVSDRATVLFKYDEILTFEVCDTRREIGWYGKFPGVVRPNLDWEIVDL